MKSVLAEKPRGESGNVLIVTLLILFAISIIGATLAMVSSMDLKISGNQRKTSEALFVAEAGLNEAIHRLSLPDPTDMTVGGWTGNVAIGDSEPYDPNWTTLIYLTDPASAPAGGGSVVTTGTLQDPNRPYLEYSVPSGSEGVVRIEHKWRDLNGDGARDQDEIVRYDPLAMPPENFTSGFPVEVVTVTGRAANGERVIQAEVARKLILGRTLGALYVDKAIKITGQSSLCGYNHDIQTPPGTEPNACFGWHLGSGHLPGVTATGDEVNAMGSVNIFGDPIPIDNQSTNPFYSLSEVLGLSDAEVNDMLADADNTSIQDPIKGITYITGDANIASALTGEGLLYITGDLHASGNFIFKGLIYVEGDVHFTGDPWILGSMIVRGTADFNFSSGNCAILYSQDAITRFLNNSATCLVLSWREI
jgi:hypothetical protein